MVLTPAPRDIVARGRTQARVAVALMLIPHIAMPLRAFLARHVETGGIETARLAVWIGFLYLVYRGFRLIRWIVFLYTVIVIVLAMSVLIRALGHATLLGIVLSLVLIASMATGLALLLFAPAIRPFLRYQLGDKVPYPTDVQPPRGLTSA